MQLHQTCALLAFLSDQSELSTRHTGRKYWTINIWIGFLWLDYLLRILWDIRRAYVRFDALRSFQQKPLAPCWTYIQIFTVQYFLQFLEWNLIPMKEVGKSAHCLPLLHPNSCIHFRFFPQTPHFFFCSKQRVFFLYFC